MTQENRFLLLEKKLTKKQKIKFRFEPIPNFDYGVDYLDDNLDNNLASLHAYVKNWWLDPAIFLSAKNHQFSKMIHNNDFIVGKSILDNRQDVKFLADIQPENKVGRKVALIHLMHWNGTLRNYDFIVTPIRKVLLPISTFIHVPAGRDPLFTKGHVADYEMVSPNLGKTIFEIRQNVIDIACFAKYLKQEMGFVEVGVFSYSIGSLISFLTTLFNTEYIDFAIYHHMADSFARAVIDGVATQEVAKQLTTNLSKQEVESIWSVISPGSYINWFDKLPRRVRLIQPRYDYVFTPDNIRNFNDKILSIRSDIDFREYELTHNTMGKFPEGWQIMMNNIAYIYKNTLMGNDPRSILFN